MNSVSVDEVLTGTYKDKDNINPSHYKQGEVECIDALESATMNLKGIEAVCTANAIKYLWRWKEKGGRDDLHKAQWYITRLLTVTS
jgi:hypothetical protein